MAALVRFTRYFEHPLCTSDSGGTLERCGHIYVYALYTVNMHWATYNSWTALIGTADSQVPVARPFGIRMACLVCTIR
jgi:hypothetical protein